MPKRKMHNEEDDKENTLEQQPGPKRKHTKSPIQENAPMSSQQSKPPVTPASKNSLPELISASGIVESAFDTDSPEERITWAYEENTLRNSVMRGKKRARSSSPISSPARASAHFRKGPLVNPQKSELNIPFADPGSEMWGKFTENSQVTPLGHRKGALNQLMQTSSPKQNRDCTTPRLDVKLRRAISCGTHWPSNKRRKIVVAEERVQEELPAETAWTKPSKGSMVSALIEKVLIPKQSLAKTPSVQSSSPTPAVEDDIHDAEVAVNTMLVNTILDDPADEKEYIEPLDDLQSISKINPIPPDAGEKAEDVSDYGEFDDDDLDDLDDEALLALEEKADAVPAKKPKSSSSTLPADDEFGEDFDEDFFAADVANIASKYDAKDGAVARAKMVSNIAETRQPSKSVGVSQVESDDEFGEDIDDAVFEAAASQVASQSLQHGSLPPVRTRIW